MRIGGKWADWAAIVAAAYEAGVGVDGVAPYRISEPGPGGLVFGFAVLGRKRGADRVRIREVADRELHLAAEQVLGLVRVADKGAHFATIRQQGSHHFCAGAPGCSRDQRHFVLLSTITMFHSYRL